MAREMQRTSHQPPATSHQRRGFTLIEMLVVIAVTAILLTVVFRPLFSSFDLTNRASTQIESQAAARDAMRQVSTLLGNAVYVYDNSGPNTPGSTGPNTSLNLWLRDSAGAPILVTSRFSMVEYVAVAHQLEQTADSILAAPIDPTTGEPIYSPSLSSGQSGVAIPVSTGRSLGRIWIGPLDNASGPDTHTVNTNFNAYDRVQNGMPLKPYANHFEDPRTVDLSQDNRFTLWNAEVPIYILDPINKTKFFVPNLGLFHIKTSAGVIDDSLTDYLNSATRTNMGLHPVLHDPNFFYDNSLAGGDGDKRWAMPGWIDINKDGKVQIWENWRAVGSNLLLGNIRKVDLVSLDRDPNTNAVLYFDAQGAISNNGWPHVRPLARFAPATVQNDAGIAAAMDSAGNESPSPVPTAFSTQFTHWANPFRVLIYRNAAGQNPLNQAQLEYYEATDDGRVVHIKNLPQGSATPDPYVQPDVGPMIDPAKGIFKNVDAEFAFNIDSERGIVNFAFPSTVLIHDANGNPLTAVYNPAKINALADTSDPPRRALSLQMLDPADNPNIADYTRHPLSSAMKWYSDVRIVPGTETVFGPDQRPGAHYGFRVQYTRVPNKSLDPIGPNQYKINYENEPNNPNNDPALSLGFVEFRSGSEGSSQANVTDDAYASGPYDPNVDFKPYGLPEHKANPAFDPTTFPSAANPKLLQAPSDPVEIFYKFQMNRTNDVVKVDYLTRELMNVTIEARLYDPASSRPQSAILTQKLKVRNLQH